MRLEPFSLPRRAQPTRTLRQAAQFPGVARDRRVRTARALTVPCVGLAVVVWAALVAGQTAGVGDVRFAIYSVPDAERSIPMTMAGAEFAGLDGETITLREFGYWPRDALSGEIVQVRLLWSADERPSRPYKVFLHLLDNSGQPVAQRDSEPVGGFRPTVTWQPGEVIEDNYGLALPADLTAGTYELRLGLYDAFDPVRRLAVGDQDGLTLGSVIVAQPE